MGIDACSEHSFIGRLWTGGGSETAGALPEAQDAKLPTLRLGSRQTATQGAGCSGAQRASLSGH